jgi:hypothetical protein
MGLTYASLRFANLFIQQQVLVNALGDMGAMDFVVDPRQQTLIVNPQHPNYPVAMAK